MSGHLLEAWTERRGKTSELHTTSSCVCTTHEVMLAVMRAVMGARRTPCSLIRKSRKLYNDLPFSWEMRSASPVALYYHYWPRLFLGTVPNSHPSQHLRPFIMTVAGSLLPVQGHVDWLPFASAISGASKYGLSFSLRAGPFPKRHHLPGVVVWGGQGGDSWVESREAPGSRAAE
jgi:hypothetical protein